eukprot:snap_masked-scaffold_39-processed-gene-1.51-mRNA-1 protein AED:1.00 eAED:1.00 QI:0/-1/0/0/-1/1/1/0/144
MGQNHAANEIDDMIARKGLNLSQTKNPPQLIERVKRCDKRDVDFVLDFEAFLAFTLPGTLSNIGTCWLPDDDGYIMLPSSLLLHILLFQVELLRVLLIAITFQNAEETSRLRKELRMSNLLNKFMIRAKTVGCCEVVIEYDFKY